MERSGRHGSVHNVRLCTYPLNVMYLLVVGGQEQKHKSALIKVAVVWVCVGVCASFEPFVSTKYHDNGSNA